MAHVELSHASLTTPTGNQEGRRGTGIHFSDFKSVDENSQSRLLPHDDPDEIGQEDRAGSPSL